MRSVGFCLASSVLLWLPNLPQAEAQLIITDTQVPNQFRTIGVPVNMDAWYKAFGVKGGYKRYKKPGDRIRIW